MSTEKVVITGGPGTGKTSIIKILKEKGFFCFDEIIRSLTLEIKKEIDETSLVSNPIAFANDSMDFNTKLLDGRVAQFKLAETQKIQLSFFDRGIPDVLAYMDYFNQEYSNVFTNACKQNKYTSLFILPPWKSIYKRDNERFETFEESEKIYEFLIDTYKAFGYNIIKVPFDTIENRTNFILDTLNI